MKLKTTIGKQIALLCLFLFACTSIVGGVGWFRILDMQARMDVLTRGAVPAEHVIGKIRKASSDARALLLLHVTADSTAEKVELDKSLQAAEEALTDAIKQFEARISDSNSRDLLARLKSQHAAILQAREPILAASRSMYRTKATLAARTVLNPLFNTEQKQIEDLAEWQQRGAEQTSSVTALYADEGKSWMAGAWAACLVAGTVASFFLVRRLNRRLRGLTVGMSQSAREIDSAAAGLSASSGSLGKAAAEQSEIVQQSSASARQITLLSQCQQESARGATQLMEKVDQQVSLGNRTLEEMQSAMSEICASNSQINRILRTIDEIAFQTNLLALNAAVEAARAGASGAGFAVVAEEVRSLAQRCAEAAKDTAPLIEAAQTKAQEGSTKLDRVSEVFRKVTSSAREVQTLIEQVGAGSEEQTSGMRQIADSIARMEQSTKEAAAGSELGATTGGKLNVQAERLRELTKELAALTGA